MAQALGVMNALWMAGIIIARLDGYIAWAWWLTLIAAGLPFAVIALGCLWATMYDAAQIHRNHEQ